jgi:calcium-dependent protein kinase
MQKNIKLDYKFVKVSQTNQECGKGTYGKVYLATNKKSGATRAIKVIPREKIKNIERFKQEVHALKMLVRSIIQDHPNIVKLYEIYEDEPNLYLVQE